MTTSNEHNNAPAVPQEEGRPGIPLRKAYKHLLIVAPAQEFNKSVADAEIKAMYVESQGSDKGWLGIEGSYFIGGVVAARKQKAALAPAQDEPLGHFRAEPFGWTDCAEDDEGAIALYERPQEVGLTDEEIEAIAKKHMSTVGDHWCNEEAIRERHAEDFARAIIAALRAKGQS